MYSILEESWWKPVGFRGIGGSRGSPWSSGESGMLALTSLVQHLRIYSLYLYTSSAVITQSKFTFICQLPHLRIAILLIFRPKPNCADGSRRTAGCGSLYPRARIHVRTSASSHLLVSYCFTLTYLRCRTRSIAGLIGAFLALFCTLGFQNAFGVFQEYYAQTILRNHSEFDIAWIGSLLTFVFSSSPLPPVSWRIALVPR